MVEHLTFNNLFLFFQCAAQPPGVPEITRKSLESCMASEKPELYIIGKHFQKESKVVFQQEKKPLEGKASKAEILWKKVVAPITDFYNPVSELH